DHPVNRGRLCPKGLTEHHTIHAPGRLTHPLVNGRRAGWDEAVDRVVASFTHLLARHGPDSVAVLSTGQLVTEEFYALGKLVRLADLHLPVRPRTDITLVNGILHVLFAEGLADEEYLAAHTVGVDELRAHVAAFPPERVAAECGVPADDVRRAARVVGRPNR